MKRLTPVDLAFLLLGNPSRMVHMATFQIFQIPAGQRKKSLLPGQWTPSDKVI